ncbi:hypothetical protein JK636_07320 [Clostridium sp. YIM B02515]|uniref:DUF4007 family protein n=1 Tax=Clostridium rhizosphaerae TaxID=2803861 RepID=A0ABS1T890_9CLOT|nr:hypothetical protein [Clostridium rhizosphaerae]MBL4935568.1 hypothetical protein [Clostridium rhizosphaerae]
MINSHKSTSFHGSFQPQLVYLSKILELASQNYEGNMFDISRITGIPTGESTGKVVPHIKYMEYMGLIKSSTGGGKYKLALTKLGEVVYSEDKYLLEDITKQALHYYLTHQEIGAPQWSYLFREYPYEYDEKLDLNSVEEKGKIALGKPIEVGPLKGMYSIGDFSSLNLIEYSKGSELLIKRCYPKMEAYHLYAFTLIADWEKYFSNQQEITIDIITDELKWNRGFGFDYDTTLEVLDELCALGYVNINKQLMPITIIRNSESKDIINLIYSDLI